MHTYTVVQYCTAHLYLGTYLTNNLLPLRTGTFLLLIIILHSPYLISTRGPYPTLLPLPLIL